MTKPTTVARAAVRLYHSSGAPAARTYLGNVLSRELGHTNPSMVGNARNTLAGLDNYITADVADGRAVRALDQEIVLTLRPGPIRVRYDVILDDADVAARVVLWDGPDYEPTDAPLIAAVYARGLQQLFSGVSVSTVGIWQARRDRIVEVPFADALSQLPRAEQIMAAL